MTQPISFWVEDPRTIGVAVFTGSGRPCAVAAIDESDAEIRVAIECRRPWLSLGSTAAIHIRWFTIHLASELGARTVVDGNGQPARVCARDRCEAEGPPNVIP